MWEFIVWLLSGIANIIWLAGTSLIILAYYLTQTWKITPKDIMYTHINFAGSVLLLISLIFHFNLASFILEIIWIWISILWYYNYFNNKNK